ncbi:secretion-regulating guanine nucleotide exchange factor [Anopheles maculipalpis]|uniref:secretion-regulating guanine nucleotide exchange factor n=1 Tax=Anopheles maculipalpis TaxID=1496333 RepID=UPI0021593F9D|nr:secretion-regulating guanine nucleotide exchange factor [Anopheles maculipalpis]
MFAWGANSHAQLGLGYASEQCDKPQPLTGGEGVPFRGEEILVASAGGGHTLIGTTDGKLYACGWNNRGQLGMGHLNDCLHFELVGEYGFQQLYAGWDVSAGINAFGELFVWGSNVWQQIAVPGIKNIPTPTRLTLPDEGRVLKVAFGLQYMVVLMESGKVWVLGKCKFLANDYPAEPATNLTIRCISDRASVRDVVSGDNHLVLVIGDRKINCLGDGKHGQCLEDYTIPEDVIKLESGWTHSGCLTVNGAVYLWGRNNYGQLGLPGQFSSLPQKLRLETDDMVVKDLSLGSQHGAVVTKDGQVACWGWNEHGNCGTGGTENVWFPTVIDLPRPVSKVVCGAGFTMAFT